MTKKKIYLSFFFSSILFLNPLYGLSKASFSSLAFPSFDLTLLIQIYLILFLLPLIFIIILLKFPFKKINILNIFFFLSICALIKQIDFYIIDNSDSRARFLFVNYIIIFFIGIISYKKVKVLLLYNFNFIKIFSILSCLIFIFNFGESWIYIVKKNNSKQNHTIIKDKKIDKSKILILTFEKIPRSFFLNEDFSLKRKFKNLNKLRQDSILFKEFNTTSTQTATSLRILYSGEKIKKRISTDHGLTNSIFKILNKNDYLIYYLNDFIHYPCQINYVFCIKVAGEKKSNIDNKKTILKKWLLCFSNYYLYPNLRMLIYNINEKKIIQMVKQEQLNLKFKNEYISYADRQITEFFNILIKNKNNRSAIIMHNFLTDGTTTNNSDILEKYIRLEKFDNFIGKLIKFLKSENMYQDTFLFISSDTGSDELLYEVFKKKKKIKYSDDGYKIFTLLKFPNVQNKNKLELKKFSQEHLAIFLNKYLHKKQDLNLIPSNKTDYILNFQSDGKLEYVLNNNFWIKN